ncbi:TetR/AcrR family transcriptional regulator [Vineibacter terrae]|uniref:TetR/AcrR family transcriptional regulator n=1 Tax=Vineibacter terrae TaxID=2586908 RepID=UPI002E30CB2D|nr:TetR/AcrR family transcriptional regulator [Vineibacter terrae]HEX2892347.1 TetR/AcrR family transcriptional regulator [Vineibacter terrae]
MASAAIEQLERSQRRRLDKFNERRTELAQAALQTLSELGYARTSLREIAQNSAFSHGVLHYYFADKVDLIMCCVRHYKAQCVTRYDHIIASASSYDEMTDGFVAAMAQTLADEATLHRLWYDLRAQSLFEPAFRADVAEIDKSLQDMIWRIIARLAALAGAPQTLPPPLLYAMFDGLFQQALLKHLSGEAGATTELQAGIRLLLSRIFPAAA